jgi:TP901 family phage tail tape measure protein
MARERSVATLAISMRTRLQGLQTGLRRARRMLRNFARTISSIAKKAAMAGAAITGMAVGVGYAFARIARSGEMFNRKLLRSQAIMTGITARVNARMKQAAYDVARSTMVSAEQAAEAYYFLASAGLNAEQSIKALPAVAQFAQAGFFDMAQATDLLTDAQKALDMTVTDANANLRNMVHISDVLVKANRLANASVQQFSEALTNKAGAKLKVLNKDLEEGVAILAAYADQGLKASEAGTALNIVFRDLETQAALHAAAFKKYNIAVFDSAGNMRKLWQILQDIERTTVNMSHRTRIEMWQALGIQAKSRVFTEMLIGLSQHIRDLEWSLRWAAGTTAQVAASMLTPWEKAMAKMGAAWTRMSDVLLSPVVHAAALAVEDLARNLENLANIDPTKFLKQLRPILNQVDALIRSVLLVVIEAIRHIMAMKTAPRRLWRALKAPFVAAKEWVKNLWAPGVFRQEQVLAAFMASLHGGRGSPLWAALDELDATIKASGPLLGDVLIDAIEKANRRLRTLFVRDFIRDWAIEFTGKTQGVWRGIARLLTPAFMYKGLKLPPAQVGADIGRMITQGMTLLAKYFVSPTVQGLGQLIGRLAFRAPGKEPRKSIADQVADLLEGISTPSARHISVPASALGLPSYGPIGRTPLLALEGRVQERQLTALLAIQGSVERLERNRTGMGP